MTYDEWVNENYDRMERFARSLGGGPAGVDEAVRRTLESDVFPTTTMDWWAWHCSTIRSVLSTSRRSEGRHANKAHNAGALLRGNRGAQFRHWTDDDGTPRGGMSPLPERDPFAPPTSDRPPFVNLHLNWRDEATVQYLGACRRCRGRLYLRVEREGQAHYWVAVVGCMNGHRQYQEVAR